MTGNARGKFISAEKFVKEDSRLPEGILAQTVTGQYSNDYWELLETIDGDMFLKPDSKTSEWFPGLMRPQDRLFMIAIARMESHIRSALGRY